MLNEANVIANEIIGENNWFEISGRRDLSVEDLRNFKNQLVWWRVIMNIKDIPNDLLDEMLTSGKLESTNSVWESISKYHAADPEFIKKYNEHIDFSKLTKRINFKPSELAKLIKRPEVGMGATECYVSDSYPCTVIEVNKQGTRIKVQRDNYTPAEGYNYYGNQVYNYTPNPEGSIDELRLNKFGEWVRVGGRTKFVVGFRRKYENPSY